MKWGQTSIASFTPSNVRYNSFWTSFISIMNGLKNPFSWEIAHDKQPNVHDIYCVSKEFKDSMGRIYKRSYLTGCSISCEVKYGEHSMICPRRNKYSWHLKCIKKGFKASGIPERNFESKNWPGSMHSLAVIWYNYTR